MNWFKRYSFLKCTCWFILLLVKNKLISTCSSIFVEWQLFARNRAVSVSTWKEPGYISPPLVSFSVCSWFMDSLDTVEGFNHFYIYIWLLESWRFLSNCGCCNISLYKWDHKLGIFLPFPENKITIAIPRIAKRSYVSLVSLFGSIKQNYRHHYPLQSIFFTCIQARICTGVQSIQVAILEFFSGCWFFFSDWNKRIELNRIVSGFIDRVL